MAKKQLKQVGNSHHYVMVAGELRYAGDRPKTNAPAVNKLLGEQTQGTADLTTAIMEAVEARYGKVLPKKKRDELVSDVGTAAAKALGESWMRGAKAEQAKQSFVRTKPSADERDEAIHSAVSSAICEKGLTVVEAFAHVAYMVDEKKRPVYTRHDGQPFTEGGVRSAYYRFEQRPK